jgi:hypothetical protein
VLVPATRNPARRPGRPPGRPSGARPILATETQFANGLELKEFSHNVDVINTLYRENSWLASDAVDGALSHMSRISNGEMAPSALPTLPLLINPTNRPLRTARAFLVSFYFLFVRGGYDRVRGYTRQKGGKASLPTRFNLFSDTELIFIPINIGDTHWTLVVIDNTALTVSFLDSLQGPPSVGRSHLRNVMLYLRSEWAQLKVDGTVEEHAVFPEYDLVETPADVPQQPNYVDCGVYVIAFAHALILKEPLTSIKANNIKYCRERWATCLVGLVAAEEAHNLQELSKK